MKKCPNMEVSNKNPSKENFIMLNTMLCEPKTNGLRILIGTDFGGENSVQPQFDWEHSFDFSNLNQKRLDQTLHPRVGVRFEEYTTVDSHRDDIIESFRCSMLSSRSISTKKWCLPRNDVPLMPIFTWDDNIKRHITPESPLYKAFCLKKYQSFVKLLSKGVSFTQCHSETNCSEILMTLKDDDEPTFILTSQNSSVTIEWPVSSISVIDLMTITMKRRQSLPIRPTHNFSPPLKVEKVFGEKQGNSSHLEEKNVESPLKICLQNDRMLFNGISQQQQHLTSTYLVSVSISGQRQQSFQDVQKNLSSQPSLASTPHHKKMKSGDNQFSLLSSLPPLPSFEPLPPSRTQSLLSTSRCCWSSQTEMRKPAAADDVREEGVSESTEEVYDNSEKPAQKPNEVVLISSRNQQSKEYLDSLNKNTLHTLKNIVLPITNEKESCSESSVIVNRAEGCASEMKISTSKTPDLWRNAIASVASNLSGFDKVESFISERDDHPQTRFFFKNKQETTECKNNVNPPAPDDSPCLSYKHSLQHNAASPFNQNTDSRDDKVQHLQMKNICEQPSLISWKSNTKQIEDHLNGYDSKKREKSLHFDSNKLSHSIWRDSTICVSSRLLTPSPKNKNYIDSRQHSPLMIDRLKTSQDTNENENSNEDLTRNVKFENLNPKTSSNAISPSLLGHRKFSPLAFSGEKNKLGKLPPKYLTNSEINASSSHSSNALRHTFSSDCTSIEGLIRLKSEDAGQKFVEKNTFSETEFPDNFCTQEDFLGLYHPIASDSLDSSNNAGFTQNPYSYNMSSKLNSENEKTEKTSPKCFIKSNSSTSSVTTPFTSRMESLTCHALVFRGDAASNMQLAIIFETKLQAELYLSGFRLICQHALENKH
eukprot:GDKJ01005653.1.p1 GENE.GDKJ01005653.1~~GDKJ01005653.1.p1  ORF type:complete len:878 (+),score=165.90 GDKJ01005653.1:28-2661(+)